MLSKVLHHRCLATIGHLDTVQLEDVFEVPLSGVLSQVTGNITKLVNMCAGTFIAIHINGFHEFFKHLAPGRLGQFSPDKIEGIRINGTIMGLQSRGMSRSMLNGSAGP